MSREMMPASPTLHVRPRPRPDGAVPARAHGGPRAGAAEAADPRTRPGGLALDGRAGRRHPAVTPAVDGLVDPLVDPLVDQVGDGLRDGARHPDQLHDHLHGRPHGDTVQIVLDLDDVPPAGPGGSSASLPGPRWRRRAAAGAVAAFCLTIGVLGGSGWSQQQTRAGTEAATRVLLWTDAAPLPEEAGTATARLRVGLMTTGSPMVVERVFLGAGSGESEAGVTLLPGRRATADLVLRPDCATLAGDGTAAVEGSPAGRRAVVRPVGSQRSREVPLEILADSSAVMLALVSPCVGGVGTTDGPVGTGDGTSAADDPGTGPVPSSAVVVSGLRASARGRLTFTLTGRGPASARFEMPVASVGTRTRFTARSHPALPVTVRPGAKVSVTVDLRASCRSHTAVLPTTYGLLLPQALLAGTQAGSRHADVPVEGWDDGVAASALTAAFLHGCP